MWIFLILSRKRFLVTQCLKLTLFQEHAYHCIFNAHLSFLMPTRVFSTVFKYFCEWWNFTKLKISNQRVLIVAMIMNTRQLSTSKPFSQRKCHNKNHSTPDLTKFPYNAITCKQQRLIFFYKQRVRQQFLTSHIYIYPSQRATRSRENWRESAGAHFWPSFAVCAQCIFARCRSVTALGGSQLLLLSSPRACTA